MRQKENLLVGAVLIAMLSLAAVPMTAKADSPITYTAALKPLNRSGGSGTLTIKLTGNQAQVSEHFTGLAATYKGAPYPHVQHIHIDGHHTCPPASADTSGDGVINTTEGMPSYGMIGTTLTVSGDTSPAAALNLRTAPAGRDVTYHRTITLDPATLASLRNKNAVIVVHGLDPSTLPPKARTEPSDLDPSLPLAVTSPALCGPLVQEVRSLR
jgi:hypothetical protein